MLALLLAIVCSSSIAILFRHSESKDGGNRFALTTANYAAAVIVCVLTLAVTGLPGSGDTGVAFDAIGGALAGGGRLDAHASLVWAALVGLGAGTLFFLGFVYYQLSVRAHGAGLAAAYGKLGILVPMVLSLVIWREWPTLPQWAGIALAVGSILVVSLTRMGSGHRAGPVLLLFLLFGGLSEFSNKLYEKYRAPIDGLPTETVVGLMTVFLLVTFGTACIASTIAMLTRWKPVRRRDVMLGIAVGVPNLGTSFFLILALDALPAVVVFPAYGAGTILLVGLVERLAFGARLKAHERVAVALAVAALVLINLG